MFKKTLALMTAAIMMFALAACGQTPAENTETSASSGLSLIHIQMCIRDRIYNVPIYSMDFNLIACMRYTYYSSGRTDFSIRFAYDDGLDYWKEMFYVYVLPMHTQAYYVYIATQSSKYLGNIQDMMLISEGGMNYSYCILTTDKGQFIYDRFYNVEDSISVDSAARLGAIYIDKDRFHMHYLDRLDAPHFIEGGVVQRFLI